MKDYYRGVEHNLTWLKSVTYCCCVHCCSPAGILTYARSAEATRVPADGVARPYQSLRWATVAGETLKNYKLIARRLCDRWQADPHQEGSTGQTFAAGALLL